MSAYHEQIMFRSPLSFVTANDKQVANAIIKTTTLKMQALCNGTIERTKLWQQLIIMMPRHYWQVSTLRARPGGLFCPGRRSPSCRAPLHDGLGLSDAP